MLAPLLHITDCLILEICQQKLKKKKIVPVTRVILVKRLKIKDYTKIKEHFETYSKYRVFRRLKNNANNEELCFLSFLGSETRPLPFIN